MANNHHFPSLPSICNLRSEKYLCCLIMNSIIFLFFLLSTLCHVGLRAEEESSSSSQLIRPGSSLSPEASSWPSLSGDFAFGFHKQGDGFAVGIWIVGATEPTVVWTANRDDPPVTLQAKLVFTSDGQLLLRTEQGKATRVANTTAMRPASFASMLDSGNFVLYDEKMDVIWESFEHPTDSILENQALPVRGQLFSRLSKTDHSTGRFHLKMQDDGNLVLYPTYTEDSPSDAYWSSGTFNKSEANLFLNYTGEFALIDNSTYERVRESNAALSSPSNGLKRLIYRATVDPDGVFRKYSHTREQNNGKLRTPTPTWTVPENPCVVKGLCGLNSYCTFNDAQTNCLCLPGTDFVDANSRTSGCLRNHTELGCVDGKKNTQLHNLTRMENMMWGDTPYSSEMMSVKECSKSCLEDCNCDAALYKYGDGICAKQKLPLMYVRRDIEEVTTAFLKVSQENDPKGRNENGSTVMGNQPPSTVITNKKALVQIIVLALSFILFSFVSLAIAGVYFFKIRVLRYKRLRDKGNFGMDSDEDLTLRVFSYNDLKRATSGFKEELGKGSFGAVYKGTIDKGRKLVAVKRLEKLVEEGEKEFRAEMRAIGRTNHRNLVRLLGYCAEDSKRLLVYEYMSNGSLADLIFRKDAKGLDWDERVRVAIEIARGILYLHEECKTPIIHCDIKPQNILMDGFWTAKISDFGLAKLLMPDQTRTFTGIRGTRGYLAPEWHKNTPISVKADVYSFGIMLLEIVCCRKSLELDVSNTDEVMLANWVYKCFATRELNKIDVSEEADKKSLENMVKVGLWCIQDEPPLRPSMKSVVLMLEGITDISGPPCPTSMSM